MHSHDDIRANAKLEVPLAEIELRAQASASQLLESVQNTGRARRDIALLQREIDWLRSCLADSEARLIAVNLSPPNTDLKTIIKARNVFSKTAIRRATKLLVRAIKLVTTSISRLTRTPAASLKTDVTAEASVAVVTSIPFPATQIATGASEVLSTPDRRLTPEPHQSTASYPVRTVHQFHAGSAKGDAITNSMLLIRSVLREVGFRSEIFVESRGAGLGSDLQLIDCLPNHGDYVLLLHHSMGFPSFERVLASPATKVLIYHNITPTEFFVDIPRIQKGAELGRKQLAELRDHVAFALADSDYNAVELYTLGFPAIRTCPLLFDVAKLAQRATGPRHGDGIFTILFVGRITPSKGQEDLIRAFGVFNARYGRPCRLVLVGALDPDEYQYLGRLADVITTSGLQQAVRITGLVSDAELCGWYCQSDLYVSLSRHEGFGVPLIEAMAHGIPVAAWPAGAIPYTLGEAAVLLTSREPDLVAKVMLDLAKRGDAAGVGGPTSIRRFALERHTPVLVAALGAAGAVSPRDPAAITNLSATLHVAIDGNVATTHGLAAVNRTLARTLESQRPGTVRIISARDQPTTELHMVPSSEPGFIAQLVARAKTETGPELVVSCSCPVSPAGR